MAAKSEKLPRHFEFSAARERTRWPVTCSKRCLPNSMCGRTRCVDAHAPGWPAQTGLLGMAG
eukprot:2556069-Prymnesium_polylepis.1